MRSLLFYGTNLSATQVLIYFSSNVDSIVIGANFGPVALGYYSRAYQLLTVPLNQIFSPLTSVALPLLSREQSQPREVVRLSSRAQVVLGHPATALFAVIAVGAGDVVAILLGARWEPAAPKSPKMRPT